MTDADVHYTGYLTDADHAACKLAIDLIVGNPDNPAYERIKDSLRDVAKGLLDLDDLGQTAAYNQQFHNLGLLPWETQPMYIPRDADTLDMILSDPDHRAYRGARVLKVLLELGISPFHPDPLVAISDVRKNRDHSGDNVL
jgi:hypothetical protein